MSIRVKLLASFGTFVLLGLIVGGVVTLTSARFSDLTQDAQESAQLNTTIKGLEVDHLRWRGKVVDAMATNAPEIGVQTDDHKCRLGKFLYGGPLEEIQEMDPELGRTLAGLKSPHSELHESARSIQSVWTQVHPGVQVSLLERLNDHLAWSGKLNESIVAGAAIDVQVDPTKCKFGKWLNSEEYRALHSAWPEFAETMNEVIPAHKRLHESAQRMTTNADLEARRGIYASDTKPALELLSGRFHSILEVENTRVANQEKAMAVYLAETLPSLDRVAEQMDKVVVYGQEKVEQSNVQVAAMRKSQTIVVVLTSCAFIIAGIFLSWLMSKKISDPLAQATALAAKIGLGNTSGRLTVKTKDEIGQLASAMNKMADGLEAKTELAGRIAEGDLTAEVKLASTEDGLGIALDTMVKKLKATIGNIQQSATELKSGSSQVADSSQVLSQGATESAASLEEISASLTEIDSQISETAENSNSSLTEIRSVQNAAGKAEESVNAMNDAMTQINEGSEQISQVIKVIDDIAFQTNLLALNAAVEAARAGQHGKGFAVVAEEVRNLAGRSAKAARETSTMISESIQGAKDGSASLEEVNRNFSGINQGIESIGKSVEFIAQSANNQAKAISEITEGTKQLDAVTQNNSATSEESAAAAEELSAIAATMAEAAGQFKLSDSNLGANEQNAAPWEGADSDWDSAKFAEPEVSLTGAQV
jgi:methyl-accepting chemotaxis protein